MIRNGEVDEFIKIVSKFKYMDVGISLFFAIKFGHFEIVKLLVDNDEFCHPEDVHDAVQYGRFKIFKFLVEHEDLIYYDERIAYKLAAKRETLKLSNIWLSFGCNGGHWKQLKWLPNMVI